MVHPISRRAFVASAAGALSLLTAGCAAARSGSGSAGSGSAPVPGDAAPVRVASLKGPTTIGLVPLMEEDRGRSAPAYDFTVTTAADEVVPGIIKGDFDIALVPANVASVLYNKTAGGVVALDINTLGVLHVVTGDPSLVELADLAGRTVYLTGKGAAPEYGLRHLLACAGVADQVRLEFKSEPAEVVSVLASDPGAAGVLPQPFVTAALAKNGALSAPIALADAWSGLAGADGSQMVTGVTVARRAFARERREAVGRFIEEHRDSAEAVLADPAAWAAGVVEAGIVGDALIAERAIPSCGIACITGDELEVALAGYLHVLYEADPASVGGAMPAGDFYFQG